VSAEPPGVLAVAGPVAPAPAGAPAPDGLPCLNSNNSNDTLLDQTVADSGFKLSPYQAKALFALTHNIAAFIDSVGIERIGFLTLTFDHKVFDLDEASGAFNRLNVRVIKEFFGGWIRVIEEHKDGSWHYHLLVEMPCDIRTGFNFEAFQAAKEQYQESGKSFEYYRLLRASTGENHPLPKIWKDLRQRLKPYGFGRFELVPVRTNKEGISKYIAKYLSKGLTARRKDGRRVRLTAYCRKVKRAVHLPIAWASSGARLWRMKVGMTAEHFGCKDLDDLSRLFGNRWAYHLKDLIASLIPPEMTSFQLMKQSGMYGDGLMQSHCVESSDAGQPAKHTYGVIVLPDKTHSSIHEYDRDSWNDLIYRAMACKLRPLSHSHRDSAA